jgi:hypothetical protein
MKGYKVRRVLFFTIFFISCLSFAKAQFTRIDTIQFSGIVVENDSLNGIPYVHIYNQRKQGTITNERGAFGFHVAIGDTLTFSSVGKKTYTMVVPDTLTDKNYVTAIVLNEANIFLSEVLILPWLTKKDFKKAFIEHQPTPQLQAAQRNINTANYVAMSQPAKWDSDMVIKQQLQQYSNEVEHRGLISGNDYINVTGMAIALAKYIYFLSKKPEMEARLKQQLRTLLANQKAIEEKEMRAKVDSIVRSEQKLGSD